MTYNFGKDIVRTFIPYENDEPFNLVSQSPQIFLFSTQPSAANAANGTGAIGGSYTLAYWIESQLSPFKRTYTIPAIPGDGTKTSKGFWEAINFIQKAGGPTETVVRSFDVESVEDTDSWPTVTRDTLKSFYPAIGAYLSDPQLDALLGLTIEEVKLDFENKGVRWTNLYDLNKLKLAVAYRAIANGALSQIKEQDDRFHIRYEEYKKKYENAINSINLPVDSDNNGAPDTTVSPSPSFAYISR